MSPYDRAGTTQRIHAAAEREFALYGVAGARMDRIAEAADAGKALIYSYFGNKEQLFAQVISTRLTQLAEAVELQPRRVPEYVGDLFDFMTSHPDVLRLVLHEAVQFDPREAPHQAPRREHYGSKAAAVAEGQQLGLVDPALEPRFVVMSLISLVSWYVAAPQITQMVLGEDTAESRSRYRAHLVELARRAVAPPQFS
ncbi:TetR/AcrR family transcriptional regulator [Streptomyces sp. NP160]|uniref:TetR family transcriptional regulator n=1 Tax=Streptomyces sp. NP160 TaxID=2586637 RepID=UPI001119E0BE|nr:TetR family transcriptional regulator [Streptomyces sp. NP160]TNM63169.1 TetR/AcrR family transcriptional regulator [Streptomyces sp. NP160]